jgi:DNA-binding XRE family transcriptional regulator
LITMTINHVEAVDLGRAVVSDGRLKALREQLGLTRNAMAELLQVAWPTYSAWEDRAVNLRPETAARVGRFYTQATGELALLQEHEISVRNLVPFHVVATLLGIPQEQLLYRYREGQIKTVDAGILGLWMQKSDLAKLRSR